MRESVHTSTNTLFGYARGTCEPVEARDVERHLEVCPTCRDEVRLLQGTLGTLAAEEAPRLSESTRRQLIATSILGVSPAARRPRRWLPALVAAAAVVAIVFGVWKLAPTGNTNDTVRIGETVELDIAEGAQVDVRSDALLYKEVVVTSGRVEIAVHNRAADEVVQVVTPNGTIRVIGTVFVVDVDGESTEVTVSEGRVTFVQPDRQTLITAGQTWMFTPTPAPTPRPDPALELETEPAITVEAPLTGTPSTPTPTPVDAETLYRDAEAALREGRTPTAVNLLETLVTQAPRAPSAPDAWLELARIRETTGQKKAAVTAYRRYLELPDGRAPLKPEARAALCRLAPDEPGCVQ